MANREFPVPDFNVKTLNVTSRINAGNLFGASATTPASIGDASTTSRALVSEDDLIVTGKLEIDGWTYCDNGIKIPGSKSIEIEGTNAMIDLGGAAGFGASFSPRAAQTPDCLVIGTGATANHIIIMEHADISVDMGHAQSTNPTLFIHSADSASPADWVSISHNQTDGVIDCGSGTLNLGGTANVNFAGATATGTGDVAINGYVTLEVAGTAVKFATVA